MSDNKRFGRGFAGKGYYIALILCAAAIGITGYVYYQNPGEDQQVILTQNPSDVIDVGTMATEEYVAAVATRPQELPGETMASKPTVPTGEKKLRVTAPVSGEEIFGYSMEALSYNQTTRDWRVHNGVDIAAEAGTPVLAAADGTVYTTYEDDAMGTTVVIRHTGGYTTSYSSLDKETTVQAGDVVTMGQTIGYVGSTALVESTLGSHVHFSVTGQEGPMDPAEFLAIGK